MKTSHRDQADKTAKAARVLKRSDQIVGAQRGQRRSITKMQIQTMDHRMGVWDEQIKLPKPKTVSALALLSELKPYYRSLTRLLLGQTARLFQMVALNPLQFGSTSVLRRVLYRRQSRTGRRASP